MQRILFAGCGYVGQAAADLFHATGRMVEGWTRSETSAAGLARKPYPVRGVDLSQRAQVAQRAAAVVAVIHCASSRRGNADSYRRIYLEGTLNLLESFPRSKRLFSTSTRVYAQRH